MDQDFKQLLGACAELSSLFPDGIVFFGGMAVYLHAINEEATRHLAETTHDADLYISQADLADLREIEELTSNRRLSRHQMIKRGFEFDIYTERMADLPVPYDEIMSSSEKMDEIKVAGLEHLLALKMAAYQDRKASVKGEKDARDIVRIACLLSYRDEPLDATKILPYWHDEELDLLDRITKGPAAMTMSGGNAHEAKIFRTAIKNLAESLRGHSTPSPAGRRGRSP